MLEFPRCPSHSPVCHAEPCWAREGLQQRVSSLCRHSPNRAAAGWEARKPGVKTEHAEALQALGLTCRFVAAPVTLPTNCVFSAPLEPVTQRALLPRAGFEGKGWANLGKAAESNSREKMNLSTACSYKLLLKSPLVEIGCVSCVPGEWVRGCWCASASAAGCCFLGTATAQPVAKGCSAEVAQEPKEKLQALLGSFGFCFLSACSPGWPERAVGWLSVV